VNIFIVRDLDSFLYARDAAAVTDWLENTTKPFHAFRDHPFHIDTVLGGLWGGRNALVSNDTLLKQRNTLMNQSSLSYRNQKNSDQIILAIMLFPPNEPNQVVSYDAYFCEKWRNITMNRPFPTKRVGNEFLGDVELWGESGFRSALKKCPIRCRPDYGKLWCYC